LTALAFPSGFVWGAATSAFQIEGATTVDHRGESIWDRFAATPGRIEDGSDGRQACEHYQRWPDDVALVRDLGLNAYRFSIAWPRIQPTGRGPANPAGLDFYDRLVDGLLAAGVAPFATLYHWDLPQPLEDRGGWAARDTALAFADYVEVVTRRLGDRVGHWMTINEPWCVAVLGYEQGAHAPGHREPARALAAAHHTLLAHGRAVPVIRANARAAQVGIVLNLVPAAPATDADADRDAARWFDGFFNRWFLEPLYRGAYPDDAIADRVARGHLAGPTLPFVADGDLAVIATPTDFLGVNYYNPVVVRAAPGEPEAVVQVATGAPRTDMGWEVRPEGPARLARSAAPRLPAGADLHHRERRRLRRSADRRRRDRRPPPHRLPARPPGRAGPGDRRRRAGGRLLPLVAPRQLRVGLRLHQALRPDPRRLHQPAPHASRERAGLPRHRGRQRGRTRAVTVRPS
jgi:beta-glucosidase